MFIQKVRCIAEVYPHTSFEAIVNLSDDNCYDKTLYFNFDVTNGKEIDADALCESYEYWSYRVPLDAVDFNTLKDQVRCSDLTERRIITEMIKIWNANPKWDSDGYWLTPDEWKARQGKQRRNEL